MSQCRAEYDAGTVVIYCVRDEGREGDHSGQITWINYPEATRAGRS